MPDFKLTFQEEVRRLARKEVKAASETLAAQQKTIREMTKRIDALEKKQAAAVVPAIKTSRMTIHQKACTPNKWNRVKTSFICTPLI